MIYENDEKPPRVGRAMAWRFAVAGILLIAVAAAATATAGLNKVSDLSTKLFPVANHVSAPAQTFVNPAYDGAPETYLILGSDRRAKSKDLSDRTDPPHSDTILLVRFDPSEGQTSVLSIPRDLEDTINGQIAKINSAYTDGAQAHGLNGGIVFATQTVEHLLPQIKLDGVIDVSFAGFIGVVDGLGCVYVNVDHRYYNLNIGTAATNYANIDLQPGYQKLCYDNALSYVRYREDDSDFVRVARQHDFLRDLRDDVSLSTLESKIGTVAGQVGDAIATNIPPGARRAIDLFKLIAFSQKKPLRQVPFRFATDNTFIAGATYVTTTPQLIRQTEHDFLYGDRTPAVTQPGSSVHKAATGKPASRHAKHGSRHSTPVPLLTRMANIGLYQVPAGDDQQPITESSTIPFRVFYPTFQTGPAAQVDFHAYTLPDRSNPPHIHHAYVDVWQQNIQGGYYDIEGTDWLNPPLVAHPDSVQHIGKRTYMLIDDGAHIHIVAWRENHVLYFVTNTLLEDLSNTQMIALARSVTPLR